MSKAKDAAEAVIRNYQETQKMLAQAGGVPHDIENSTDRHVVLAIGYLEAVAVAEAAVSGLGLKKDRATPKDVAEVIDGLQAEAALYRRGYHLIGACDIGNYLARCAEAGEISEA